MSDATDGNSAAERLAARPNSSCYVCGLDNPRGLRLSFEQGAAGEMSATWIPDAVFVGFEGIVHGGLVSTVLDESMAKAVAATGVEALTAEIRVRFRRHVVPGNPVHVRGWVVERNKRIIEAQSALVDPTGTELAHAWSSFLVLH